MNEPLELIKSPLIVKIAILAFASVATFYLGRHFSTFQPFISYTSYSGDVVPTASRSVAASPNANPTVESTTLIPTQAPTLTLAPPPLTPPSFLSAPPPPPFLSAPPPPFRYGIVDENGTMTDNFEVGEFDPALVEKWDFGNETSGREADAEGTGPRVRVWKYRFCDRRMNDYIPCLDNVEEIKNLKSTERGERLERHCRKAGMNCLIPAPKGYKVPIPWPRSRDEV